MLKRAILLNRTFASAAANPALSKLEQKVSKLDNGLTVASVDAHGPISHFVVTYRAGSRYEQPDELGLVHRLRNSFGLDTANYEGSRLVWQAGSLGASLTARADQEFVTLHLAAPREHASIALSLLAELSQPAFKPWDLEDSKFTQEYDLAFAEPFDHLLDAVHRAAYRNGPLANPLLSPDYRINKTKFTTLEAYAKQHLVTGEASIFGFNVNHEQVLLDYASRQGSIPEGKSSKTARPSPYIGGEVRIQSSIKDAHVAIVGEGAKLSDTKGLAVQTVLASIIGQGPNSKFATHPGLGVVNRAVQQAASLNPVAVAPLSIPHSDSGLVGVYIAADGSRIEPYVKAAAGALKQLASGPSQEDFEMAKRQAAVQTLLRSECGASVAEDQAVQLLVNGSAVTPVDFAKQIEGVSIDDVKKAAAKLTSKFAIASYGTIDQVPLVEKL